MSDKSLYELMGESRQASKSLVTPQVDDIRDIVIREARARAALELNKYMYELHGQDWVNRYEGRVFTYTHDTVQAKIMIKGVVRYSGLMELAVNEATKVKSIYVQTIEGPIVFVALDPRICGGWDPKTYSGVMLQ